MAVHLDLWDSAIQSVWILLAFTTGMCGHSIDGEGIFEFEGVLPPSITHRVPRKRSCLLRKLPDTRL